MKKNQDVIIKIKKVEVAGDGGGSSTAWKIAYSDFITALMSFFLVMWLITMNSGRKVPEKVIVTDFITVSSKDESDADKLIFTPPSDNIILPSSERGANAEILFEDPNLIDLELSESINGVKEELGLIIDEKNKARVIQITNQFGLLIELVDSHEVPFFAEGKAIILPEVKNLLRNIAQVLKDRNQHFVIIGHTDATPCAGPNNYSNWNLSFDRANAVREFFVSCGVDERLVKEIRGDASNDLFNPEDPIAPENRRVTIFVPFRQEAL